MKLIYLRNSSLINVLKTGPKFTNNIEITKEQYEFLKENSFDFEDFKLRNKGTKIIIV